MKVNYFGARKDKGKHKCVFCMVTIFCLSLLFPLN